MDKFITQTSNGGILRHFHPSNISEDSIAGLIYESAKYMIHDSTNVTIAKSKSGLEYPLNVNLKKPAWLQYLIIGMSIFNLSIVAFTVVFQIRNPKSLYV
jgi:hypothetical protein